MPLFTSTLILISAVILECHAEQTLTCHYQTENKHKPRVWCKRDTNNQSCCTGFTFGKGIHDLDGESLSVADNGESFTVSVKSLSQGDGVYWCGIQNGDNTIIKLAEKQLYNPMDWRWFILRWLLFGLLLLTVTLIHVCSCRKAKVKYAS